MLLLLGIQQLSFIANITRAIRFTPPPSCTISKPLNASKVAFKA